LVGNYEGDLFEDLGLGWRIILMWILQKWDVEPWTALMWLRNGQVVVYSE
jgi:hypothetical protein